MPSPHDPARGLRIPPGRRVAAAALIAVLSTALLGCATVDYLVQGGCGQLDIALRTRDIGDAINDEHVPARTRALLRQVGAIKSFGEKQGLTPTSSYATYADLERPAAVWVVSASEPLRFHGKSWSFPIVGSVPYLGFFDRDEAALYAAELASEGWDVDLRGASAYSTLGWFDDPVLSTMLSDEDGAVGELTNVVLHESLHATVYFAGQTPLNESLASFVADELSVTYLDSAFGPSSPEKTAYLSDEAEHDRRQKLMHRAYERLDRLYASAAPPDRKLAVKRSILDWLQRELGASRNLSNASLAQVESYNTGDAELRALLAACGGSWPRFVAAFRALDPASFTGPQQTDLSRVLAPLARGGCTAR